VDKIGAKKTTNSNAHVHFTKDNSYSNTSDRWNQAYGYKDDTKSLSIKLPCSEESRYWCGRCGRVTVKEDLRVLLDEVMHLCLHIGTAEILSIEHTRSAVIDVNNSGALLRINISQLQLQDLSALGWDEVSTARAYQTDICNLNAYSLAKDSEFDISEEGLWLG
jgi:hypothetical protein